jgi:acetyl esterase/lipase
MNRRALLLGFSALAAAPAALAAPAGPLTFRYAQSPGAAANLQSLDVYGAEKGARRPVMAFIHGGGWAIGDKANPAHGRQKAPAFVARGMVFASLNYRLSPAVKHPAHIRDVAAAIAWLHDHCDEIGGDRERLYVMGHSAGAHLAALVATDETRLGAHDLPLTILKGAIPIDGAGYDISAEAPIAIRRRGLLGKMYADAFGADGSLWADASPVSHVAPGKGIPPFLLPYTGRPSAGAQANELAAALKRAHVEANVLHSPNQNHMQINHDIGKPGDMVTEAIYAALSRWGA